MPALNDLFLAGDDVQDVAERYGISVSTVYNWIRRAEVNPSTMAKLQQRIDEEAEVVKVLQQALLLQLIGAQEYSNFRSAHQAGHPNFHQSFRQLVDLVHKRKALAE